MRAQVLVRIFRSLVVEMTELSNEYFVAKVPAQEFCETRSRVDAGKPQWLPQQVCLKTDIHIVHESLR